MELYAYTHSHYPPPPRASASGPKMHSTITFPGSSGRRGSLPVTSNGFDALASPASTTSPRTSHTPVVPNGQGLPLAVQNGVRAKGIDLSPKRQRMDDVASRPQKKVMGPDARGMEDEVQRLLASCEAQEQKIKRTKENIEGRLFLELDTAIASLSDIDREADDVIDQLDGSLVSSRPLLAARLSQLIATHQAKVGDMEATSTPWRELLTQASIEMGEDEDPELHPTDVPSEGAEDEIRPAGKKRRKEEGDEAALARIEGWAGEVKNYLISEIALLRAEEAARKKGPLWYTFWALVSSVIVTLVTLFIISLIKR